MIRIRITNQTNSKWKKNNEFSFKPFLGPRLENSPYAHLLDDSLWHEISDMFVKDACALMGLSIESPLTVAVNAGATALPSLLNIKQVCI